MGGEIVSARLVCSRPNTIEELAHQEEVVNTLRTAIVSGNLPHLLFHGPPGTGKTSAIHAVAKQLFGPRLYRSRILELNASDERGIAVVRDKIKKFAQKKVAKAESTEGYDCRFPCPPIQIIILDEADSMTGDAQAALRRIIENYTKTTRFCILCNYLSKIIDPIVSRCMKFRFNPIAAEAQQAKLAEIAGKEGLQVEPDALPTLVRVSEGDMRKSITAMQCATKGKAKVVNVERVLTVMGVVPQPVIKSIMEGCKDKSMTELQQETENIICEGYSVAMILSEVMDYLLESRTVTDPQKANVAGVASETEARLLEGGSEDINLLYFLASLKKIMQTKA